MPCSGRCRGAHVDVRIARVNVHHMSAPRDNVFSGVAGSLSVASTCTPPRVHLCGRPNCRLPLRIFLSSACARRATGKPTRPLEGTKGVPRNGGSWRTLGSVTQSGRIFLSAADLFKPCFCLMFEPLSLESPLVPIKHRPPCAGRSLADPCTAIWSPARLSVPRSSGGRVSGGLPSIRGSFHPHQDQIPSRVWAERRKIFLHGL